MPTVYGIGISPFVRKVRVALAEKGLTYDHDPVIPVNVSPEYRTISPLGKVPAYRDGDRTLADSSVIIAYIDRMHPDPPLYPSDPYDYARALWFEAYADGASPAIFSHGVETHRWPKLAAYLAGIHERPSFKALISEERAILGA